jgi:hypothetical protein
MSQSRAKREVPEAHVPEAHEGPHYANASSKPLLGPDAQAESELTQRVVWKLFFVLILCVIAMSVVLGLVWRHT